MPPALMVSSPKDHDGSDKRPGAFRTISELSGEIGVPQHVLRFWETRFAQIKPMKRAGGRRFYRPEDADLVNGVRQLLQGQGYTIRGAQRVLRENGVKFVQAIGRGEAQAGAPLLQDSDGEDDGAEGSRGDVASPSASEREDLAAALNDLRACRAILASLESDGLDPS